MLRRSDFIVPCSPVQRSWPPTDDAWLHEVKFDGWRIQLHKSSRRATVYTKSGNDFTRRFPGIAAAVASLPVHSVIIDGELTACDDRGVPHFPALHFHNVRDEDLCAGRMWQLITSWGSFARSTTGPTAPAGSM